MKKTALAVLAALLLATNTAQVFATDLGMAALGAGIGALINHRNRGTGAAIGAAIGYGISAAGRPQGYGGYPSAYGGRPWWMNGPYVEAGYPAAIGVPVYPPPIERIIVREEIVRETPQQQQHESRPSVSIMNINSGNSVTNNFYGDRVSARAIEKAVGQVRQEPAKKVKKAAYRNYGIDPNYKR